MALAIVGFALVTIFGLTPLGLTTYRQSMETTIGSHIAQRIINDCQQSDFNTLLNSPPADRYFDDQGDEITLPSTTPAIYTARMIVTQPSNLLGTLTSSNMAKVQVQIIENPANRTLSSGTVTSSPGVSVQNYSGIIANTE